MLKPIESFPHLSFRKLDPSVSSARMEISYVQGKALADIAKPVTLPYENLEGAIIQLWNLKGYLVGSVCAKDHITLVPGKQIENSLQRQEESHTLLGKLETIGLRKWHFSYEKHANRITIWPFLQAAGLEERQKKILDECERKINERADSVDKRHCQAAWREDRGEVVAKKKDGTPFQHNTEVGQTQGGLKTDIAALNRILSHPKTNPHNRQKATELLSRASTMLDTSATYHKPPTKKHLSRMGKAGLTAALLMGSSLFGKTPAEGQFRQVLQQTHLTDSYNGNTPGKTFPARGMSSGQIGGVGHDVGMIEGLFEHPESIFDTEHFFGFKCRASDREPFLGFEPPFSNEQLQIILRELAIGIYAHETVPFFSLEFNEEGHLFPTIHPVYEKTLVGKVIGLLDYMMKGYLNGGVFNERFILDWQAKANWQADSALDEMIAFSTYFSKHLPEAVPYLSLHQMVKKIILKEKERLLFTSGDSQEPKIFEDHTKFTNSFRIIAKQNAFKKDENLFVLDPDFDVFYDLHPDSVYQEELDKFRKVHGRDPIGYRAIKEGCEKMSKEIHDHMQKLPLFKRYFSMVEIINFFSSYFLTLKSHDRVPSFAPIKGMQVYACPAEFPELPVTRDVDFEITLSDVVTSLDKRCICQYLSCKEIPTSSEFVRYTLKKEIIDKLWTKVRASKQQEKYLNRALLQDSLEECADHVIRLIELVFEKHRQSKGASFDPSIEEEFVYDDQAFSAYFTNLKQHELLNPSIALPLTRAFDDLDMHSQKVSQSVSGGTGMNLKSQRVQKSPELSKLLEEAWPMIHTQQVETWSFKKMPGDETPYATFRLEIEDAPEEPSSHQSSSYQWMEQLIQDGRFAEKDSKEFYAMANAIAQDRREVFTDKLKAFGYYRTYCTNFQFQDRLGRSLLHLSAMVGPGFYADRLLAQGFSCSQADAHGYLPIHYAAMRGHTYLLEEFLKKAPKSLHAASRSGATPLTVAIQYGQKEAVSFLLEKGSHSFKTRNGYTPILCALHEGNLEIIHMILDKFQREDIDVPDGRGTTPLMLAAELSNHHVIERLLTFTFIADLITRNKQGKTALDIAIEKENLPFIELVKKRLPHYRPECTLKPLAKHGTKEVFDCVKPYILESNPLFEGDSTFIQEAFACRNMALLEAVIKEKRKELMELRGIENFYKKLLSAGYFALAEKLAGVTLKEKSDGIMQVERADWVILSQKDLLACIVQGGDSTFSREQLESIDFTLFEEKELVEAFETILRKKHIGLIQPFLKATKLNPHLYTFSAEGWKYPHFLAAINAHHLLQEFLDSPRAPLPRFLAAINPYYLLQDFLGHSRDSLHRVDFHGGKTLPYIAAESGSHECLQVLLEKMDEQQTSFANHFYNNHLLVAGCHSFNEKTIRIILRYIKTNDHLAVLDSKERTLVHYAARGGFLALLEDLRNISADLSQTDTEGMSPLSHAIQSRQFETGIYLAKAGCLPRQKDLKMLQESPDLPKKSELLQLLRTKEVVEDQVREEESAPVMPPPMHTDLAAKQTFTSFLQAKSFSEKLRIAKDLPLEKLISSEEANTSYSLPLIFHLIQLGRQASVELQKDLLPLIEDVAKKHPHVCDQFGHTLYHFLVQLDVDSKFLEWIDVKAKNFKGATPLHIAASVASKETFHEIVSRCSQQDLEQEDHFGETPIFYAVKGKQLDHMEALLKKGVNLHHPNSHNAPCILPAIREGNTQIIRHLLPYFDIDRTFIYNGMPTTVLELLALKYPNDLFIEAHQMHPTIPKYSEVRGKIAHILAREGNIAPLRYWLQKEKAVAQRQEEGVFAWDCAAQKGHLEMLKLFQKEIPDFLHKGNKLLSRAAIGGQKNTAKWLVDQGVLEDMDTSSRIEAYKCAVLSGCPETVHYFNRLFIQRGKGVFQVLPVAIQKGNKRVLSKFYEDKQFPVDLEVLEGMNSLHIASSAASLETTKYLVNHGADLTLLDRRRKCSALAIAAKDGSLPQFRYLLKKTRVRPNEQDEEGQTLLHLSAMYGNVAHVALLLDLGYDPNIQDEMDMTPLQRAAAGGHIDVVKLLIFCGTDLFHIDAMLDQTEKRIETGLEQFTRAMHKIMAFYEEYEELLEHSHESENPLHLAVRSGWKTAITLLARRGDYLNKKNHEGNTPLHLAARLKDLEALRILILNGGDVKVKNKYQQTCLDMDWIPSRLWGPAEV